MSDKKFKRKDKASVGNASRRRDLLLALSHAAQSIQRARSEEEVYRAVGEQVKSLGGEAALYIYAEGDKKFFLAHTTYAPRILRRVEALIGDEISNYRIAFPSGSVFARCLESGKSLHVRWTRKDVSNALPAPLRSLAEQLAALLNVQQGILAPLCADQKALGLLIVNGSALTEDDAPAVESFAAQIALSLRNVRLSQRMQSELAARRHAEAALRVQSAALEAAANAIAITDKTGVIQWVNPAWERLTGYSKEESVGHTPRLIRSGNHRPQFYEEMWKQILAGKVWRGEMTNRRKDGSLYFEEQTITPVLDEQGNITHFIAIKQDITERKQTEAALERMARTDSLTGFYNRRHLFELAGHEFDVARRYKQPLAVIMFDLDHFKEVNDTFGHITGDRILEQVAEAARAQLRDVDLVGRYGGEEFIILSPMTGARQARQFAERIRREVEALRIPTVHGEASVTLSFGIAEIIHDPMDSSIEDIIRRADKALYAAKQGGRNRTVIFRRSS
ncbi:MAG: diguanylate cyclase [Chloroflexi bacterium]|nr:diguanylate cyclase [Chloroflexota bacterium]